MKRQKIADQYETILNHAVNSQTMTGLPVIKEMLEDVITVLEPWKSKIQRPMSEETKKKYAEKGIDISWNLHNPDDGFEFYLMTNGNKDIPEPLQRAALLVRLCTEVIDFGRIQKDKVGLIISSYRWLDEAEVHNRVRAAKKSKDKKSKTLEDELKTHWENNIDPTKKATDAAILLERCDVYKGKPKRSTLEGYVRKWQQLLLAAKINS